MIYDDATDYSDNGDDHEGNEKDGPWWSCNDPADAHNDKISEKLTWGKRSIEKKAMATHSSFADASGCGAANSTENKAVHITVHMPKNVTLNWALWFEYIQNWTRTKKADRPYNTAEILK